MGREIIKEKEKLVNEAHREYLDQIGLIKKEQDNLISDFVEKAKEEKIKEIRKRIN